MTIELAPQSPAAMSAKPTEGSAGQKYTDKPESGSAKKPQSFLTALACAEEEVVPLNAGATTAPAANSVTDWLVATDSTSSLEQPLDAALGSVPVPALLLAQAPMAPVPEGSPLTDVLRGKAAPGKDLVLPMQAAGVSALDKSPVASQVKSSKAVLDAAAQAAQPELIDASGGTASATAMAAASKDAAPERIHKFVQELTASLARGPEASTVALGSNRERPQELQTNPRVSTSDVSSQNWLAPQGAGGAMGIDGVVAGAETAHTDGQYAEQVSYWIGQDVQKAEMTLEGLGASPVEVSISMQGKEATVVFRSDEALTRDALSNASAQLQDAMSRQGVVLSGVSVGTSNSGGSPREGSGGKPHGWKLATVDAAAEPATHVPRQGASGRSIDLYV